MRVTIPRYNLKVLAFVRGVLGLVLLTSVSACASPYPAVPRDRDAWGVFDADLGDRWLVVDAETDAPLLSFALSAEALGCSTERGGRSRKRKSYSAVLAQCDAGTMVLTRVAYGRSGIGCLKPTSQERCEALLDQIVAAGRSNAISGLLFVDASSHLHD